MKNEIVLFENQGVTLEVNLKDETVWLTQAQMAKLFNTSRTNIIDHINNVYSDKEVEKKSTCQNLIKFQPVRIYDKFEKKAQEC